MKKLFSYLDKIGADYRRRELQDGYFYNVDSPNTELAQVCFDYTQGADYTRQECKREKAIERYCKRYGYSITEKIYIYGFWYIHIERTADAQAWDYYNGFKAAAVAECETEMHKHGASDKLRAIMDRYGAAYREFLAATA